MIAISIEEAADEMPMYIPAGVGVIVGLMAIWSAVVGVRTGCIQIKVFRFSKQEEPLSFWCVIVLQLLGGLFCVLGGGILLVLSYSPNLNPSINAS